MPYTLITAVKLSVKHDFCGGGYFTKTFKSAAGAARFWSERTINKWAAKNHNKLTYTSAHLAANPLGVLFTYDSDQYKKHYNNAYRRSFKIFKALGMK